MDTLIKKNPLFFAWFFPALVDGIVTLAGQNGPINEASPAYYFLLASPWVFVAGSMVWFVGWYLIFKRLKEPINLFLMFLFIAGHAWGSSSWIWRLMKLNGVYEPTNQLSVMLAWGIVVGYFALIALIASRCLRLYHVPGS